MKNLISICLVLTIAFTSCHRNQKETEKISLESEDWFQNLSQEFGDSLIQLEKTSQISFPLAKVSALETENNTTLEWMLTHGMAKDFENLLYNGSRVEFKAIGIKGLVRTKNKDLFKHLNYSFTQNINLQYSLICQKLGGYFLHQLDYSTSDEISSFFTKDELEKLNKVINSRNFGCD